MAGGVPLYFPEGIPDNVMRLLDPDVIHQKVLAGVRSLEQDWKKMAPGADDIAHGRTTWWDRLFRPASLDPEWLHYYLYQKPSTWGVSKEEQQELLALRHLRQLGSRGKHPLTLTAEMKANTPSPSEVKKALKYMANDMRYYLFRMQRSWHVMLDKVGAEIEPLCDQVYGEPCPPGQGGEVAQADIADMFKLGRTPFSDPMENTLSAFLGWQAT